MIFERYTINDNEDLKVQVNRNSNLFVETHLLPNKKYRFNVEVVQKANVAYLEIYAFELESLPILLE